MMTINGDFFQLILTTNFQICLLFLLKYIHNYYIDLPKGQDLACCKHKNCIYKFDRYWEAGKERKRIAL